MSMLAQNAGVPRAAEKVKGQIRRLVIEAKPGARLPSIAELARQLNVGQTNTHRAVKQLVAEGLLVSHPGLGTFVREEAAPDHPQAARRTGIDIILSTPEPSAMVRHILDGLREGLGDQMHDIRQSSWDLQLLNTAQHLPLPPEPDAVVLINPNSTPRLTAREGQSVVVIKTGAENPLTNTTGYDFVSVDHHQGGCLAGAYARQRGLTRPCFIGHRGVATNFDETSTARLWGFERGFQAAVEPTMQLRAMFYTSISGARAFAQFAALPQRPDVVFLASDDLALGFALAAESQGLQLGREVNVIGFDGQPTTTSGIDLTSVAIPFQLMGRRAADLLIERLADPAQPVRGFTLGCTLKAGNT